MNYKSLITLLSEQSGKSERAARQDVAHTISAITELLASGKNITIPGLGTFSTKDVEERQLYSPHHEEYMVTAPKRSVEFSPSSLLNEKLKEVRPSDE